MDDSKMSMERSITTGTSITTISNNPQFRPYQSVVSSVKQRLFTSLQSRYRNPEATKITAMRAILQLRTEKNNLQLHLNESKLEFHMLTSEQLYFDSNKAKRLKKKMERMVGKIDMVERRLVEERRKLKEAVREDVLRYGNGEEGFFVFPERYPIG